MYESNTEFKEYLVSVIGNSPYGILTIDLKGKITLVNSLVLKYLNLNDQIGEIIEKDLLEIIKPIPDLKIVIEDSLTNTRKPFDLEKVKQNDRFLNIKGRKILNGLLITIEDVTQIVNYHNALLKSNKELEEFAYISAHDMKSPISSLAGLIDLMDRENAVKSQFQEEFQRVKNSVSNISKTIKALNDIIHFNQTLNIESKKVYFDKELRKVLADIRDLISSTNASVEANFSKCPTIRFPPVHLRSIFQNLISNGIKYRKKKTAPVIKIRSYLENDSIILEIKDNGIGFDIKRHEKKLFGLFQKFNTHESGLGIGLYIVHSIVNSYHGRIEVGSQINHGTTFKIFLDNE